MWNSLVWGTLVYIYTHTSGAERAAFWNGTGEHNKGTSIAVKEVKKDLETTTRTKRVRSATG